MRQTGKQTGIIELLEWAYRQELPKAERAVASGTQTASAASSWGMVYDFGILGTVIDAPLNAHGVVPIWMDAGDVHPDALIIGRAVDGLAGLSVEIAPDWSPFADWADADGLVAEAVRRRRWRLVKLAGREIRTMVIARAVLGRAPDWRGAEPGRTMVTRGGKPAWFMKQMRIDHSSGMEFECEVDGYNPRSRRPRPGAYRKYLLCDDVEGLAEERFRRSVWALAVRHVAASVAGHLASHELSAEVPTVAPWEADAVAGGATSVKFTLGLKS
ncbi:hypothetical protein [Hoeflea sp.]|uniref:hypothetical protein n=1 Tax=Hoeflea sp. TaxID=1940281 RepID=UPI0019C5C71B|nr:hypothetical protein [Hoeflea sp.]MBC7280022.1 hypothetical protein [Hoeflea sp.]